MSFSFGASALSDTSSTSTPPALTHPDIIRARRLLQQQQQMPPWMQAAFGPQQPQGGGIDWNAIERIVHPIDPGAQSQHYTAGVTNPQNPFSNSFFKTGAERAGVEASRGPIPWADAPTAAPFSSFGTPTHSTPYVPPTPRSNPFDDPSLTQPNGNPAMPQKHPAHSAIEYLLSTIFGGR